LCDFYLQHKTVSRLHFAMIHHKQGTWYLLDINSEHGTILNDKRVDPWAVVAVKEGDIIRVGDSTRQYRFRWL
jgi:pSer/pThr/pTyr-binding forkhead associated (FHA) protein